MTCDLKINFSDSLIVIRFFVSFYRMISKIGFEIRYQLSLRAIHHMICQDFPLNFRNLIFLKSIKMTINHGAKINL
jgi:hypothetical protein